MTAVADAFATGLERGLLRGKGWRQEPFPGPLDLLLALMPDYVETPCLRYISDQLVAWEEANEREENPDYLAVSLGPQEGKSTLIAFILPLWLWLRNPDLRIIIISYDDETTVRWGRAIKEALAAHSGDDALHGIDLHLTLREGSKAVGRLQLAGHRGSLTCVSLTGGISGKPGDRVILDDVVKDRRTARSAAFKRLWKDQWKSAIKARLGPRAGVVMDHTRWSDDDPIGQQLAENGDRWKYVNIPAVVETRALPNGQAPQLGSANKTKDPLGRVEGEWLISARGRTVEQWEQTRADVGEADFWALWQGQPFPAAGGLFSANTFRRWEPTSTPWVYRIPGRPGPDEDIRIAMRFLTVDLAASTRSSADWTVAAAWAIAGTGELLMLDLKRAQVDPSKHWDEVVAPLQRDWQCPIYVERSQYATDLVYSATREGAIINDLIADVDKYSRAVPAARRMGQGQVLFPPAAHWFEDFRDEVLAFPTGVHDDQVDALAYAHRVRTAIWSPPDSSPPHRPERSDVDHVFGDSGVDLGTVAL